jgi:F0F1-type ATP synthase membrane subunit b/b'
MRYTLFSLLILFSLSQCTSKESGKAKDHTSNKVSKNDPFAKTMVESQFFDIDAKEDQVVEGKNGTLLIMPKGCFKDSKGNVVEDDIIVELAEASNLEDMILSNLTTSSDGKLLESGGMLYVNATRDGEKLTINPENPLYVEMPNPEGKTGMMVYKGIRDEKGNMNWVDPKPLVKYLIPVDMSLLNFYPEGFEVEVEKGMPYRSYKVATDELKDSLYYSLSAPAAADAVMTSSDTREQDSSLLSDSVSVKPCGIDPASIKVLRSKKFEGTLIATREFERRLQFIFKTCDNSILEIYVNNMDKNLYELDSMAAMKLGYRNPLTEVFGKFYKEKLTNVKKADKKAEMLRQYYERQLKKVKEELKKLKEDAAKQLQRDNEQAKKVEKDYKELLVKRQEYRLEKFGFELKDTGWANIDKVIAQMETFELKVEVSGGNEFDRVHTYIVNPLIKSLYAMTSQDKVLFDGSYPEDQILLMYKKQNFNVVVVAYKQDQAFLSVQEFRLHKENDIKMKKPQQISEADLKRELRFYNGSYSNENKILADLEYQALFEKERRRQERLQKESEFILKLEAKAFSCCAPPDGEIIFLQSCESCHLLDQEKVGPALGCIGNRRTFKWFASFTTDAPSFIQKDKAANELAKKYAPTVMPYFHLKEEEVKAVYNYLNENCQQAK